MKKILAFILATFMVLSLVPASAFAAFDVVCPSTHTMVNCENVYVSTVPATCTDYGYDIYNCVKCGAEILDNFKEPVEHNWISGADSKHVNKAATCTTPGYEWVKKCKVCNTTAGLVACDKSCGDTSCKLYKRVITATHDYQLNGKGIGCETEYACTICGEIAYKSGNDFVASASHKWDYAKAEVVVAPSWNKGVFTKGSALVKCSVKGCPAEKTVEISSMDCQHYAATIVKAYAKETCFVDGSKQIVECRDCSVYFVDANKNGEIDDNETELKDKDGKATKDLSYAVVNEIKEHKKPAAGYSSTNGCVGVFTCELCKTVQSETYHTAVRDINPGIDFDSSCLNVGYDFKYCEDCKTNITETVPAKGHDTKTITVAATCVNAGAKYTICVRSNCTLGKQQIIDAKGEHVSTLTGYGLGADVSNRAPAGNIYMLRVVKTESAKAIDSTAHTLKYTNVNNPSETSDKMLTTDCTGYKIVQITCSYGCSANSIEFVPAADHDEYVSMKYANCNQTTTGHSTGGALKAFTERVVYSCKSCAQVIRYEENVVTFATQYATETELKYYHGQIYYAADASYKLVETVRKANVVLPLGTNLIAPTCTATGLKNYACTICATTYYVTDAKVAHTPEKGTVADASDYTGGKDATCTAAGKWDSFKCAHCSGTIILNPYTGKQEVVTDLTIKAHGSTLVKKTHSSSATWCAGVTYYECEECGATFTNWDAKTKFDKTVENHTWVPLQPKTVATCNKNGKYEIKYCSNASCRRIEVNAWFEIEGEVYEINVYSGTRKYESKKYKDTKIENKIATLDSKGKWANKTFTITAAGKLSGDYDVAIPMLDHKAPLAGSSIANKVPASLIASSNFTSEERNASGDHTTPGYVSMQCNYCSYEYFTDYVAASKDHVNVSGQVIPADCTNSTITDRFCIYCDAVVTGDHKWTTTAPMTAPATCVQSGYEYYLCKLCGFRKMDKVIPASDDYHTSDAFLTDGFRVENGQQSNYAYVGTEYSVSCALCNKNIGTAQKPADIKAAGLEILINTNDTTIIPGSTVTVEVSIASLKGVNVWALAFPVEYDAEVFEFVGYEWNTADSAFQTFAVTEVAGGYRTSAYFARTALSDGISVPSGILSIVANADAGVTVKEEELLVTLTFKVISADAVSETFTVCDTYTTIGGSIGKTALEVWGEEDKGDGTKFKDDSMWVSMYGKLYVLNDTGIYKEFAVEVLDENGKAVNVNYNGYNSTETITIAEFLDLDNENGITLADAYKLYALIYNNEYDVRADANYDGKVDGRDLSILYAVYTGVITVEQLITPDAELPAGFEAWMGAK